MYVSPYRRTHETLRAFHLDPELIRVREEPRLREQDWGNWQDRDDVQLQKAYRDAYGHFFYRFAQGECGADVYDRVGGFLESLYRSFEAPDHPAERAPRDPRADHAAVLHALVPLDGRRLRVARPTPGTPRCGCSFSATTADTPSTGRSSAGASRSRTESPEIEWQRDDS